VALGRGVWAPIVGRAGWETINNNSISPWNRGVLAGSPKALVRLLLI